MTFHRTQLLGNLGDDPDVKIGPTGTARTVVRVAVNDRWTGSDGQAKEHVEWYQVVCFGRLAEVVGEHLHKGSRVFVDGKQRTRSWQDDGGQTRYVTELHADTVEFLDGRRE